MYAMRPGVANSSNGLRRSFKSFRSLDSSESFTSSSTSKAPPSSPSSSSFQNSRLRRSSSSLCLQSELVSTPSRRSLVSLSPNSSTNNICMRRSNSQSSKTSASSEVSFEDEASTPFEYESSFPPACLTVDTACSKNLAGWMLVLVMGLHVPTYLKHILSYFFEYHAVPMLVMLGTTLPAMMHAHLKRTASAALSAGGSVTSLLSKVSSASGHRSSSTWALEQLYQNHSYGSLSSCSAHQLQNENGDSLSPAPIRRARTDQSAVDEWGHFADFDETLHQEEVLFQMASSCSRQSLQLDTLPETEDDE